jgi:hypothetical protein
MKQISIILMCITFGCSVANAESIDSDEKESNVRISVTGEINSSDTWRLDAGCHWFPVQYVGIGGSLGMWKQYYSDHAPQGKYWIEDRDYRKPNNFFIQPSVILLSPSIFKKPDDDIDIRLYGEVGAMINIPYQKTVIEICQNEYYIPIDYAEVSSNKGEYMFFDGKIGLSLRSDRVSITAGYAYSTLDVYAQRRQMKYDNQVFAPFYPKRKATHGAFLSLSVNL